MARRGGVLGGGGRMNQYLELKLKEYYIWEKDWDGLPLGYTPEFEIFHKEQIALDKEKQAKFKNVKNIIKENCLRLSDKPENKKVMIVRFIDEHGNRLFNLFKYELPYNHYGIKVENDLYETFCKDIDYILTQNKEECKT